MKQTGPTFNGFILDAEPAPEFPSLGQLPTPPNPEEISSSESRFTLFDDVSVGKFVSPYELVAGMIAAQSFSVIFGAPKTGKSFLALDLSLHIAIGIRWFGRAVTQGPVVYIFAEGPYGIYPRVEAWKIAHGATGRAGVHFLREAVKLIEMADVNSFIALLREMPVRPVLIVIDTLTRSMPRADDSSAKDMSAAIDAADKIRAEIGAAILFVHHPPRGGSESRGSSHLDGAVDMMALYKEKGTHLTLTCAMTKDFPEFEPLEFRLAPVGRSLVVVPLTASDDVEKAGTLSKAQLQALLALFTAGEEGLSSNNWLKASGLIASTFRYAQKRLFDDGYLKREVKGTHVFYGLSDQGRAAVASKSNAPVL